MNLRAGIKACLTLALLVGIAAGADALRSGPAVGEELAESFEPMNLTGPDAGATTCILCEYGAKPVALVFARELSEPVTRLVKRLDAAAIQHRSSELATTVVFLSGDEGLPKQAKQLADREKVKHTILRTYKPEGPRGYKVVRDADVTVILFTDRVVKATHAFRKGELKDPDIDRILADVAVLLPGKK
jgi:hypothetical protein